MAVELSAILPDLLDSLAGSAEEAFTPGTAPVTLKGRYHKWRPRDFHASAIPRTSQPSAQIVTDTTDAIESMGLENVVQEYERGQYYVDRSVSPSGGSEDSDLGIKQIHFNCTEIIAASGVAVTQFNEFKCQNDGTSGLDGLTKTGTNLPNGVDSYVLFDTYNTEGSSFTGLLTLDGNNKEFLWALGAANVQGTDSIGGIRTTWDWLHLKRFNGGGSGINSHGGGFFGTPLYDGEARNKLAASFVNHRFGIVRCETTVLTPFLVGANQIDGASIGSLQMAGGTGRTCIFYNCELACDTIYANGTDDTAYVFDLDRSVLSFKTFYAELDMAAPIKVRDRGVVVGTCKYGAGTPSTFAKKCFVYMDASTGTVDIMMHPRSGDSSDIDAAVKLKVVASSQRNCFVKAPYTEATAAPFILEASGGVTPSANDQLISFQRNGLARWTTGGTAGSPTVTRASIT
jgi:hypothetical protein